MANKPENPPAFPESYVGNDIPHEGIGGGMTLRDYFAGQYLQTFVDATPEYEFEDGETAANNIAKTCYFMADEMLKQREAAND